MDEVPRVPAAVERRRARRPRRAARADARRRTVHRLTPVAVFAAGSEAARESREACHAERRSEGAHLIDVVVRVVDRDAATGDAVLRLLAARPLRAAERAARTALD